MNILSHIASLIVAAGDLLLGWVLLLPRDMAILLVAVLTALVLTLVRKWCTNQDLLGRCAADLRRLKQLVRQAKATSAEKTRRRTEVQRLKGTVSLVKLTQLRSEGRVLLWSLPPLALLATWGMERLEFLPPKPGQQITLRAYYPLSSVEKLTHLVPPDGFVLTSPAVRQVELDEEGGVNGVASWTLAANEPTAAAELLIRHQERTVAHRVRIDGRAYAPPVQTHAGDLLPATEIRLPQARLLGVVPGVPWLGLAPWVVAYLLLAIVLVYPLRKLLRVW